MLYEIFQLLKFIKTKIFLNINETKDELRHEKLRSLCDREYNLEPFGYNSIELVERLINDLTSLKRHFKKCKQNILEIN